MTTVHYTPYMLPMLLSVITAVVIAAHAWKNREAPGSRWLALFALAVGMWSFSVALEVASIPVAWKIFWSQSKYFGLAPLPVLWLLFTLEYTGRNLSRRTVALLFAIPFLTIVLVWSNELHHLYWTNIELQSNGLVTYLKSTYGWWFWFPHMAYSYGLIVAGAAILVQAWLISSSLFRQQARALLLAVIVPLTVITAEIMGFDPYAGVELTPVSFAISGLILTWGSRRHKLGAVTPVAYKAVFDNISDSVYILDSRNRVIDLNRAATLRLNVSPEVVVGQHITKAFASHRALVDAHLHSREATIELDVGDENAPRYVELKISPLYDARGRFNGRVVMAHDITERVLWQKQIEHLAQHDPLTNLQNRRAFEAKAHAELSRASREGGVVGLLMIDLDGFKPVNDCYGHEAGDVVLVEVAKRLCQIVRKEDMVARLGGDEFGILLAGASAASLHALAERVRTALIPPIACAGQAVSIGASLGTALFPEHGSTYDVLLHRADLSMYSAKRAKAMTQDDSKSAERRSSTEKLVAIGYPDSGPTQSR